MTDHYRKATAPTETVLADIAAERQRIDERWGEQNHPIIGGSDHPAALTKFANAEATWKKINDQRAKAGTLGWDSVLLEEVYEALTASNADDQRTELVQVAAVAAAAVECLDRKAQRAERTEPSPEPEAVPLWRAAETWGDDIEVQSVRNPTVRWRIRGGKARITGGNTWQTLTSVTSAPVTLASREPYRDDPWTPGQDVTMRLMVGDTPPEGTILADRFGYLYRVEADGTFTSRTGKRWSRSPGRRWANDLSGYAPVRVATPDQLKAAGIEVQA